MGFLLVIGKVAGGSEGSPVPPNLGFHRVVCITCPESVQAFFSPVRNKKGSLEPSVLKVLLLRVNRSIFAGTLL
jgi:hypothetical protein